MNRESMARNLVSLRKKKGETQEVVASNLNISSSSLAQYETGQKVPRDDVKIRIASYYETTVQDIFFSTSAHLK